MKRLFVLFIGLFALALSASADGDDGGSKMQKAHTAFQNSDYSKAKSYYQECLSYPRFAKHKRIIEGHIRTCDERIAEQRQNAIAAEKRRQAKFAKIKRDSLVYISVNVAESGHLYERVRSAMSEVLRQNKRSFCRDLDDALTIVTVLFDIKPKSSDNGFYKMVGSGTVILGNVLEEKEEVGQWTIDCEATSVVDMDDAERLLMNKLNHKLGYALDNLLTGRPQEKGYYIPEQTISVMINSCIQKWDESYFRGCIEGHISKCPGVTLSTVLNENSNAAWDKAAKISANYVKNESRVPIHEFEGFSQMLLVDIKCDSLRNYTFVGQLSDYVGTSLTTVTINGADFGIADLSAKNQELAAKLLAVGLGFKEWIIGEDVGGYKLASVNGMHGLILCVIEESNARYKEAYNGSGHLLDASWRMPVTEELLDLYNNKKVLGLTNAYWATTISANGKHEVVDFRLPKENAKQQYKYAEVILVKEF